MLLKIDHIREQTPPNETYKRKLLFTSKTPKDF